MVKVKLCQCDKPYNNGHIITSEEAQKALKDARDMWSDDEVTEDIIDKMCEGEKEYVEQQIRDARLNNIPTRGFAVSADLEKITAESYKYLTNPEEFEAPVLYPEETQVKQMSDEKLMEFHKQTRKEMFAKVRLYEFLTMEIEYRMAKEQ